MYSYVRRRKRLLLAGAVGVAGAALAYYLWPSDSDEDEQDLREGSDVQLADQGPLPADRPSPKNMDGSMADHFQYIQGEAAPDQLESLMPRLQALLFQMTDVPTAIAALPPDSSVKAKLQVMAQHSLARPLAAVWLIPLTDLLVRAKLNFIGRHVFLEEKLSKLRQPHVHRNGHRMRSGDGGWGLLGGVNGRAPPLPPRIHGSAIEAFLLCTYMETAGAPWLIQQVLDVVGTQLANIDLQAPYDPAELSQLLELLHANIQEALALSLTGWTQLLLGDNPAPGPHQAHDTRQAAQGVQGPPALSPASASPLLQDPQVASVEAELQRDLRHALASSTFADAVDASVQHTLRTMITHVQELFPDEPPSTANNATAQPGSRGSVSGSSGRGSEVGDGGSVSGGNGGVGSPVGSPGPRRSGQVSWADLTRAADRGRASWGGAVYNAGRAMCASLAWAFGRSASSAVLGGGGGGAGGTLNASQPGNNKSHASLPELVPPKPPRPLARLLKPTQAACDLLFSRAHDLSKGTAHLGPVLAFSASIFAKPIHEGSQGYSQGLVNDDSGT